MKTLIKETVIYQALDGKEFVDKNECAKHEADIYADINLIYFDLDIPYCDEGIYSFTAYKVNSENEFNMLMEFLKYHHTDIYGIEEYAGDGWYLVEKSENDWAELFLLSNVVKDFTEMLGRIAELTLKF